MSKPETGQEGGLSSSCESGRSPLVFDPNTPLRCLRKAAPHATFGRASLQDAIDERRSSR